LDQHVVRGRVLPALYRDRDLGPRRFDQRILCRWWWRSPGNQRHGNGGRLDVCSFLHFHGRSDRLLLAPYLRKFGKFTVPDFIGDRFYSRGARLTAVVCLILISVTYVIGQMAGAGVAFSRFLEVSNSTGIWIAAVIVFAYAVFGGMKGITYTQVAQYVVLIIAYTIPAVFIAMQLTGNPIPMFGMFSTHTESGMPLRRLHRGRRQQAEHVPVHPVADDRYRWSATRDHPLLHRTEGG
jgi:hypothetical protein